MLEADFVIVGSGSAGSALAYRLSEDGRYSVIVIEYGGTDAGPLIQMPAALSFPMNMKQYDWGYTTEPEPHLGGRLMATPRGKVLGGSSSINGMVYVRGHAHDFDHWSDEGATGWSFADVLPYFKRMENAHGGEAGWRGTDGPLHVQRGSLNNPLHRAFIEAGRQAGFETTEDYNGSKQEGFGPMEQTIHNGRRWSAANAYLRPALKRENVSLVRGFARRVVIENQRAVGVEIEARKQIQVVKARREVVLAASAINSPKLLMLSGVGPAAHLKARGIDVVADRPGVGQNLQDHLELYIQQESTKPITLYSKLNLFSQALIGAEWLLFKSGLGATNHFEAAAFVRSRAGVEYPDLQYHFLPVAIRYDGKAAAKTHGFQAHVGPMRSKSRGAVTLRSADPHEKPSILFNYLAHPDDWSDFRHAIRLTREIFAQPAFDPYRGDEIAPGAHAQSDGALDDYIREHVESAYHPCGTCRMGRIDDPMSVVDPECRVIGVEALRVVDSSIFPRVTNGNINAPSIMVGEKGADHILGKTPLPPSNQEPWINPRWCESDRKLFLEKAMQAQPQASHYIDGRHVEDETGTAIDVIYPATGETIARVHSATPEIVEQAVEAARSAQRAWARLQPVERGRVLRRAADIIRERNDELARLETLDTGKAIQETLVADPASAADALEFFGGAVAAHYGHYVDLGGPFGYTRREPLGVCVGIGAWNYPIQIAGWKSAPALAMGNAFIFKPSENTPLSALKLAEIYTEAGLPDGLFNVVQGLGDVGEALVGHRHVDKVSLTGSVPTGKKVLALAGSGMKHATMELGGKSPIVVFDDADVENAVGGAMLGNFYSTGQVCSNGTRVLVQKGIYESFLDRLTERTKAIRLGDPLDPDTHLGPLIGKAHFDKVTGYIEIGKKEGATLHHGGGTPSLQGFENGFFVEPAIFTDVKDDMRIAREEIFGPVMSVFSFADEDEAVERANDTEFGLSAGVFTRDMARAHRVIAQIQAGTCWINTYNITPVELPFGGFKQSGVGRENALAALDHYSQLKAVYVETGDVGSPY